MWVGLRVRHIDDPDTSGIICWVSKTTQRIPWLSFNNRSKTVLVIWDRKPRGHKTKDRYWLSQLECVTLRVAK